MIVQSAQTLSPAERKATINLQHALPVTWQCQLLSVSRSSVCCQPGPPLEWEYRLLEAIDKTRTDHARAGCTVGVTNVFIETHEEPDSAPSVGPSVLAVHSVGLLMATLAVLEDLVKRGLRQEPRR